MAGFFSTYTTPVVCAVVIFVLVGMFEQRLEQKRPRSQDKLGDLFRIPVVDLQGEDIPVFDVAEAGDPVVFRGAAHTREWTSRGGWSVDAIARRCGFADASGLKLKDAYAQSIEHGPRFVMVRGTGEQQGDTAYNDMHIEVDQSRDTVRHLPSASLRDIVADPRQNGEYRYWFGPVENLCAGLTAAIPRHEMLFLRHEQELVRAVTPAPTLWVSGPNTTAQLHYDPSHNFHTLLQGSKTVRLYPPAAWVTMSLYPYSHPARRQLQRGAKLPPDGGLTVTLRAGDTLYIPPFWFHQVTAGPEVGGAVSITVVSPSRDEILQSAYILAKEGFPPSRQDRMGAALAHLRRTLSAVRPRPDHSDKFVPNEPIVSFYKHFAEVRHIPEVSTRSKSNPCNVSCWESSTQCAHPEVSETLMADAERLGRVFSQISSDGVRDIVLGDYVETVLVWALQSAADQISCYAVTCLEDDIAAAAHQCSS